ncbi:poly(A) binding protein interacting protein 1 isoform X2 [Arctopsyche grandis]|uniref:poly(A) binding protein interacting protein 1 isoform X2 n=1 Tax=Arctopsyche grandis TaxID=121162 RepID=UPI00406D683D
MLQAGGGAGGEGAGGRGRGRGHHPHHPHQHTQHQHQHHHTQHPHPHRHAPLRPPRSEDKPKSTLSAEAKEWFPPNYVPPTQDNYFAGYGQPSYDQQRFSVQDRIRYNQHPEEYELQDSLSQLITMLDEVTYSPGRFATLSGPLVDSFSLTLDDVQHTQPLVEAIVNQAIREQNFRYNGARLCTMFDSVALTLDTTPVFRTCLLERCTSEENNIVSGMEVSSNNICGFAMFLAELYMQLENPEGGRIKALGESLCNILKHMLGTPDNNSTKSVCQILKLSGLALDADCKLHVDAIFTGLRTSEAAGVQAPLVRNLINLRQSRWGSGGFAELVDSESTTPTFHSQSNQNGIRHNNSAPPISGRGTRQRGNGDNGFYLPEGHRLTSEETAFLNQHLPQTGDRQFFDDGDILEDSDNDVWGSEMNEEQHADFLEFLRISNQIAR